MSKVWKYNRGEREDMSFTLVSDNLSTYYDSDKECYMSGDGQICYQVSEEKKVEMREARKHLDKELNR